MIADHENRPVGRAGFSGVLRKQRGVTAIEYALLGSLIAVVAVGSIAAVGGELTAMYDLVADQVCSVISCS